MLDYTTAKIAFDETEPEWLGWPHLVCRLGNSFLPVLRDVLRPQPIGLWPLSPSFEANGDPADRSEYYPLFTWSHPKNQDALTKSFFMPSSFFVTGALNDESHLRNRLSHVLVDQWEFEVDPVNAIDLVVKDFGWAGISFYPDNMLLLLLALPQNALLVQRVEEESAKLSILTGRFIRDSESKLFLDNGYELLKERPPNIDPKSP